MLWAVWNSEIAKDEIREIDVDQWRMELKHALAMRRRCDEASAWQNNPNQRQRVLADIANKDSYLTDAAALEVVANLGCSPDAVRAFARSGRDGMQHIVPVLAAQNESLEYIASLRRPRGKGKNQSPQRYMTYLARLYRDLWREYNNNCVQIPKTVRFALYEEICNALPDHQFTSHDIEFWINSTSKH